MMKYLTVFVITGACLLFCSGCASIDMEKLKTIAIKKGIPAACKAVDKAVDDGRLGPKNAEDIKKYLGKLENEKED